MKMKKLNVLMAGMAVAALASCGGAGTVGKVAMNDVKDTISYSIGMGRAVRVYKDQLPVEISEDQAALKAFMKGFMESANNPEDNVKLAYALGFEIGSQEMTQAFKGLSNALFGNEDGFNKDNYVKGFYDGMIDNWDIMSFEEADETSNRLYTALSEQQFEAARAEGEAFIEAKAKEDNVVKTASGLLYEVVKLGNGGPKPTASSNVEVRYRGELIDGTVFDESEDPISLNLGQVIPGWTEGVQLMSVGDKYRFYIPQELAYGSQGQGSIKPYSALIFEVELVSIK